MYEIGECMKKVLWLFVILSLLLCGCESVPEETGVVDYDKMDKEFGQMQEHHDMGDDSVQFHKNKPKLCGYAK